MARPKLPKISDEMKAWSAALEREVGDWPQVTASSFFGLTAFRRKDKIFALLPRTRAMGTANSMAFKLEAPIPGCQARLEANPRIAALQRQKSRWFSFEVSSHGDLHNALEWLRTAYVAAGKKKKQN
jgi:hypothetical protein